jgi:hypothetical protein
MSSPQSTTGIVPWRPPGDILARVMRRAYTGSLRCILVIVPLLWPGVVAGQDWTQPWSDPYDRPPRVDISASAGFVVPSDWSDLVLLGSISPVSGILEQVVVRDVRVEPSTVFDANVTYWRGRTGFRVHGGYSTASLTIGGVADEAGSSVDVDTWLYDVRAAVGLIEYAPSRWIWPYAFAGLGGITYDLSRTVSPSLLSFIDHTPSRDDAGRIFVADPGRQFVLSVDELGLETVLAANFGVGADFRIPIGAGGVGLRVEASDHVSRSPLGLRIREFSSRGAFTSDTTVDFGFVHHLRVAAGLVVQIGR